MSLRQSEKMWNQVYCKGPQNICPRLRDSWLTAGEDWAECAWHAGRSRRAQTLIELWLIEQLALVRSAKANMTEERVSSLPIEPQVDVEGTGSDAELERGGKQAKFDEEDSDNDSTISSSNSNSTQATVGKRGFRGKGRKKKSLAFRCVNFLKVTCFHVLFFQLITGIILVIFSECFLTWMNFGFCFPRFTLATRALWFVNGNFENRHSLPFCFKEKGGKEF